MGQYTQQYEENIIYFSSVMLFLLAQY